MPPWKHGGGWSQDLTTAHLLCCRFRVYACPAPASHVQLGHRVLIPNPLSTRRTRNRSSWRARIYRSSPIPLLAAGHNFGIDGSFLQGQFEVDFVVAARHRGRRRQLLTRWKTYNHFGDTWEDEDNIVPKSKVSRYDKGVPVTCDAMWGVGVLRPARALGAPPRWGDKVRVGGPANGRPLDRL